MSGRDPFWEKLAGLTPARIGLGRSGAGVPTQEVLKFGLAHAEARDAVHTPLDGARIAAEIAALGLTTLAVASAAADCAGPTTAAASRTRASSP